jgi:cytochrome P450
LQFLSRGSPVAGLALADESEAARLARDFSLEPPPPDFHIDPYRYYAALREHDPLRSLDQNRIFVTRYADVERIYKDPKTFSSDKAVEFGAKFGPSPL